jgi:hypothetical protein
MPMTEIVAAVNFELDGDPLPGCRIDPLAIRKCVVDPRHYKTKRKVLLRQPEQVRHIKFALRLSAEARLAKVEIRHCFHPSELAA